MMWAEYKLKLVRENKLNDTESIEYAEIKNVIIQAGIDIIGKRSNKRERVKEEPQQLKKARRILAQARRRVLHQMKQKIRHQR